MNGLFSSEFGRIFRLIGKNTGFWPKLETLSQIYSSYSILQGCHLALV
jgi:hypothetical protein